MSRVHFLTALQACSLFWAFSAVHAQNAETQTASWWCASRQTDCYGNRQLFLDGVNLGRMAVHLATPFPVDWNGDGLTDIIVGEHDGTVRYWEGVPGSLEQRTGGANPFGIIGPAPYNPQGQSSAAPVAVDWNSDGQLDLILAVQGLIKYYKRKGNNLTEIIGQESPFNGIKTGWIVTRISVADWDADGDLDLLIGDAGVVRYFEQTQDRLEERLDFSNPFHGVNIDFQRGKGWDGKYGAPVVVDWDSDGDLDLILGQFDGSIKYYQRLQNGGLELQTATANPFHGRNFGYYAAPAPVDLDSDGALELVVGTLDGSIDLYSRYSDWNLVEREDDFSPFDELGIFDSAIPAVYDIDGDGSFELLIRDRFNRTRAFKRGRHTLIQEVPLQNISNRSYHWQIAGEPLAADWDADGDLDQLTIYTTGVVKYNLNNNGTYTDSDTNNPLGTAILARRAGTADVISGFVSIDWNLDGHLDLIVTEAGRAKLRYFESGWCKLDVPCSNNGICNKAGGFCECLSGYRPSDCSICSPTFYSVLDPLSTSITCKECPGTVLGVGSCLARGICNDDQYVQHQVVDNNLSRLQVAAVIGNGSCTCNDFFSGPSCEIGECPSGFEYVQTKLFECKRCAPGNAKEGSGNSVPCMSCQPGQYAPDFGSSECTNCPAGTFTDLAGFDHCKVCPAGTYAAVGSVACSSCPDRTYAPTSSTGECLPCVGSWIALKVDPSKTRCSFDVFSNLTIFVIAVCSFLFFLLLPFMFGIPTEVLDISEKGGKVIIKTSGRHWLLPRSVKPKVSFWGTGIPRLDRKGSLFRVHKLSSRELQLLTFDGVPVSDVMEASTGTFRLHARDAFVSTGWQFIFPLWAMLPVICGIVAQNVTVQRDSALPRLVQVIVGSALAMLVHFLRWRSCKLTPLARDLDKFSKRLAQKNPNPKPSDRGPSRAISIGQLLELYNFFQQYIGSRSMYYVCPNILLPITHPYQLSYAEVAGPRKVQWFVSHYWGTPFSHFVDTLSAHAAAITERESLNVTLTLSDRVHAIFRRISYWICTFSNNQWKVEEELGTTWEESSFFIALRSGFCKGTVMVFDEDAMPLTRSWCLFELLQTEQLSSQKEESFEGLLLCTRSGVMNYGHGSMDLAMKITKRLAKLRLQDATATNEQDKRMIDDLVCKQAGGFNKINDFLIQSLHQVLHAVESRFGKDLTRLRKRLTTSRSQFGSGALAASTASFESIEFGEGEKLDAEGNVIVTVDDPESPHYKRRAFARNHFDTEEERDKDSTPSSVAADYRNAEHHSDFDDSSFGSASTVASSEDLRPSAGRSCWCVRRRIARDVNEHELEV